MPFCEFKRLVYLFKWKIVRYNIDELVLIFRFQQKLQSSFDNPGVVVHRSNPFVLIAFDFARWNVETFVSRSCHPHNFYNDVGTNTAGQLLNPFDTRLKRRERFQFKMFAGLGENGCEALGHLNSSKNINSFAGVQY